MKWLRITKQKDPQKLPEAVKRQYRCAFTGHRPEKVIGSEGKIIVELRKEILKAIDEGYRVFLTGMSRGVDLWAADIVIELRRYNKDLKLMCVIPFEGMEDRWPVDWKKHYNLVRKQADWVQILSDRYSPDVYQKRSIAYIPVEDHDGKENTTSVLIQISCVRLNGSTYSFADGYSRYLELQDIHYYADEYPYARTTISEGKDFIALSKILHSDMRDFFQSDFGKEYYEKWLKDHGHLKPSYDQYDYDDDEDE